jgi:hypothetical protein
MADIEMMSDLLIGLLHGPQGGSAKIIDGYYEQYEVYEDEFPGETKVRRLFSETLDLIRLLFPNIYDMPRWANRADFYSLFVALGALLKDNEITKSATRPLAKKLVDFAEAVDRELAAPSRRIVLGQTDTGMRSYARAIEKGSNDRARRVDRHEALIELMQPLFRERKILAQSA